VAGARESVTDEVLMQRYQGGDRSVFAELVRRHKTPVYNFILRQIRTPAAAEDLTQDVFVRVVQNASEFRHSSRFSTWIYTIARNLSIDHMRKMALRRHPSLDQPASQDGEEGPTLGERTRDAHPSATVDRAAISNQLSFQIQNAVEELPEDQREVFLLREVGNVPFKDIAEMIGVSENTIKSRMRYALERLQKALAEYEDYAKNLQ
jgi:RNA polymerase sigma-70 factor (ECF subfamily)